MNSCLQGLIARLISAVVGGWIVCGGAEFAAGQAVVERHEYDVNWPRLAAGMIPEKPLPPPGAVVPTTDHVRFEAASSAAEVLPFQTVRIRQRLENVSGEFIGPLRQLHDPVLEIFADGEPPRHCGPFVAGSVPFGLIVCGGFPTYGYERELFLRPGQSTSLSFPLVTCQADFGFRPRPFFEQPGDVKLLAVYLPGNGRFGGHGRFCKQETISIRVAEPHGDDRQVYDELTRHPAAAFALTGYDYEVAEEAVPVLERLLRDYPASSYTDYIRLALARGLWGGDAPFSHGASHHGDNIARGQSENPFGRVAINAGWKDEWDYRTFNLGRRYSLLTSDFRAADAAAIWKEYGIAKDSPVRLKRVNDRLATMTGTSRERRERIVALLRRIDRERFPLAPSATFQLARTLVIDEPAAAAEEYARLTLHHADAFEWLYRLEHDALSTDDWIEYRIALPKP